MTCRNILTRSASVTALLCALAAGPAAADLTGAEVWTDWKNYMRDAGSEITGSESQAGDTLTISDVVLVMQGGEDEGSVRITIPNLTFTDNPDGTVSVGLPQTMPIEFDMTSDEGEQMKGRATYAQTGPVLAVSGAPDDMTYTYDAQSVTVTLDSIEVDGEPMPRENMAASVKLANVSNVTRMQIADVRSYEQDMSAGGLSYNLAFVVPEEDGGGSVNLTGSAQDLNIKGAGTVPPVGDSADMNAMLEDGFTMSGGFTYASGSTQFDLHSPEGPLVGTTSSDGGTVEVAMGPQGLRYDVTQNNLTIDMQQVPDIPFPVSLQMAKSAFNLAVPLQAGDEPQDFALGFTLGDFTITDAIWNLFDPAGQLPRDPATVSVDLTGEARMLADVMDPEAAGQLQSGQAAGEISALNINNLRISAVGAQASGSGAFTFDNTDLTTFNGVPRPQGKLDLRIEGANALIDKLVQMGLLPQEQAMGARMMMGLFGVPQGDDVLTSTIEVTEQGQVLANGQRLQ